MAEKHIDIALNGKIHCQSNFYRYQRDKAIRVIKQSVAENPKFYIALSGGKDSVALLAMCMAASIKGDIWAHVSDASFPGTVDTINECAKISGWTLHLDESPVSAFTVIGKQSRQKFGKSGYFFDRIKNFAVAGKYDLVFTGVRAAESKRRKKAFKIHGHIYETTVPSPIIRCDAIAHFSIFDVAAAIIESGLPIHPIYKNAPLSDRCIRLGYATNLDLIEKETIKFMKHYYPVLYLKLCNAYPKAKNYI